jgi:hypothetical protein
MSERRLRQTGREEERQTASASETTSETLEFASVEEMLRYDAARTAPPDSLATRLSASIAGEPKAVKPWWKRLLGGSK